jgi:MFS family permease
MNRRWVVVALIFAGILISYVDRGNLGIAAPFIMRDFRFSPAQMGTLLSAFFWTYGFFQVPMGAIVDRVGIRLVYAAAFVVWSLASASIGLSGSLAGILLLRMLLGMSESAGPIASMAFIRRNFNGAEAGLPTAVYIAGQNVGPAVGTLLGAQLIDHFGWRAMFIMTGLGALVWLPGWLAVAPRNDGAQANQEPKVSVRQLPWREVVGTRAFWMMPLCIFLSSYFWYFLLTWVPTYLKESRGFTTVEMGRVLSIPLFAMAGLNVAAGFLADRLVKRASSMFAVRLGFCVAGYFGSGALLLLLAMPGRDAVLPILLFAVCATGIGNANYWAMSQHITSSALVGRTVGVLNTVSQLAGASAPLITGWLLGPKLQFDVALTIAGLSPVMAAVCLLYTGASGLERIRLKLS